MKLDEAFNYGSRSLQYEYKRVQTAKTIYYLRLCCNLAWLVLLHVHDYITYFTPSRPVWKLLFLSSFGEHLSAVLKPVYVRYRRPVDEIRRDS